MPTRTIAYLRVSTEKQADRGVSLDAQRAKVKAYAELFDLELTETIVDAGESAKHLDRPGLQRALAMLKAGEADALLVVKLDRLTRSVRDLGHLVEKYFAPGKAALLSVGEQIDTRSAAGRLVLNVLASVSVRAPARGGGRGLPLQAYDMGAAERAAEGLSGPRHGARLTQRSAAHLRGLDAGGEGWASSGADRAADGAQGHADAGARVRSPVAGCSAGADDCSTERRCNLLQICYTTGRKSTP